MKKSILVVQPYVTNYRLPIFESFSIEYNTILCASVDNSFSVNNLNINKQNFIFMRTEEIKILNGKLFWQKNLISYFFQKKPDYIFITANPRYLSTWVLLLFAKIKNNKVFLHGQGLYRKKSISKLDKLIYFLFDILCQKYICYTNLSKESLKKISIYKKCEVAENSIINKNEIEKNDVSKNGILFIGRLRDGSNIEMLIKAMININNNEFSLHIIGDGNYLKILKKKYFKYSWIIFYGAIYDNKQISEISKRCIIGCYPGDAGLSVLHYMSLSLPVIVHSDLRNHMGPEVSYIEENIEGVYFKRNDQNSLEDALKKLLLDKYKLLQMQKAAFKKYKYITNPPLYKRLLNIIKKGID